MKKAMMILSAICIFSGAAGAADVTLSWDASPGATGYKISMSRDAGATWDTPIDVGQKVPYIYKDVPEDRTVLFKIAAYNTAVTVWNNYAFAAYDHRLKLLPPSGPGIL
jgi:hypothetical protein